MPKKHAPAYTQTKPTYVHPSLQSSRSSTPSAPSTPQTVNQRIQQLRREQTPRPTTEQRDELTLAVSSRTVPPDLRRILRIPEVNAPKPKPGTRTRRTMGGARPPPGPAAPSSWLERSRHAPARVRRLQRDLIGDLNGPPRFSLLARVTDDEFKRLPSPRSLVHHCLRTFALNWEELSEFEQHYLPTLPLSLREVLLGYLTVYANKGCMDFRSFKILFQSDEAGGASGWDETRFLDLTGMLNENFNLNDLAKCLKRPTTQTTLGLEDLSIDPTTPPKGKEKAPISDSWDDEDETDSPTTTPSVLPAHLKTPYFSNLSRLSLAHAGLYASWPDLLKLSPNLSRIQHLSLAYWPRPSSTPNATTTSMISNHTSIALGGSHFYSDLDDDWHEAANILRRLSLNTYSLLWLDLEGCTWLKALTLRFRVSEGPRAGPSYDVDTWQPAATKILGPDWNDAWSRVTYVNFFQGWIPADNTAIQNMPAGIVPVQLMVWLRENRGKEGEAWKMNVEETGSAVAEWVQREKNARSVASEIQHARKSGVGEWCEVDHGWGREKVS
ncbi:hypothetical protein P153DRAFT_362671 [Dothidotthia symphoricarpi CBS 119687]|uniref:Tafazzin n=1 Tax=Dothidotthia symphoricarpi CBS 119687 TaxID=1392245 RepID=A0A6A6ATG9_9PLEO|nr:uncharacterized protein P153DRAFT_362671 [Dothidotthia symphoricarpi CBS 119687]KAF2134960.1 hypothetical protein P153DRAFT_362671 [Dothidotthia symphoricarpi CBS 119687]